MTIGIDFSYKYDIITPGILLKGGLMKVILMVIYFAFTFAPILVAVTFLRKWTGEMQETTYWWVLQPIEERWCWLASAGMSWLIIAALGAFAFFGPA